MGWDEMIRPVSGLVHEGTKRKIYAGMDGWIFAA